MLQPTASRLNISNHYNDLMCEVSASAELMSNVAGSVDRSYGELSTWDLALWGICDLKHEPFFDAAQVSRPMRAHLCPSAPDLARTMCCDFKSGQKV